MLPEGFHQSFDLLGVLDLHLAQVARAHAWVAIRERLVGLVGTEAGGLRHARAVDEGGDLAGLERARGIGDADEEA